MTFGRTLSASSDALEPKTLFILEMRLMAAFPRHGFRRRLVMRAALLSGCVFALINSTQCEWMLDRFDPCGTILGNCEPGSLQLQFADVPDYDFDPTCTIPGQCVEAAGEGEVFQSPYSEFGPGFDGP